MDYETLDRMRRTHPAWRLLAADHGPLVAAFLHATFVEPNVRTLSQADLVARLDDTLHTLRERFGADVFPRAAQKYLDDWAGDERGFLRKYYPPGIDEPYFDLSPAAEKALTFLASLVEQQLVSTESRLMTVFELLRQLVMGTETDPSVRIAELVRQRSEIDAEIARIREGRFDLLEPAQVKDRFVQLELTARALLSDFRQLEQNFRDLDRDVREQIATWEGSKGAVLDEVFGARDAIGDSDQGQSFRAFWDFLMSPTRQEELSELLAKVFELGPVQELAPDRRLRRIHYDWLTAGEVAQRTVARLSGQLRRYLDDQAWLENRRIMDLIREVEQSALAVRDQPPTGNFMELDASAPDIRLPLDRPLFTPPVKPRIRAGALAEGDDAIPADALFEQVYVDKAKLDRNIRRALQLRAQVTLAELVDQHPLEQGLSELVAYLSLAAEDGRAVIDEATEQLVVFTDEAGHAKRARVPKVVFTRGGAA